MRIRAGLFSIVSIILSAFILSTFLAAPVAAQSPSPSAKNGELPAAAGAKAGMTKTAQRKSAKFPCARARWKDDPVCFGENDPSALPVPSARALGIGEPSAETRRGDILVRPNTKMFLGPNYFGYGSATRVNSGRKAIGGGLEAIFPF
jgi:hypothetical protein